MAISNRGNVDSGFISEVPDDLNLLRGVSVESLPGSGETSEDRGSVTSPLPSTPDITEEGEGEEKVEEKVEVEVWDEARVSAHAWVYVHV